ncbi:MAG: VOC family protein [Actinomycetota bacterium]
MPFHRNPLIVFVPTTDVDRALTFYGSVLDLPLEATSPSVCVFRADDTMLRVTKVDDLSPQPFTVLGWDVADIGITMQELVARGIEFARYDGMDQDDDGVWTAPTGDRIAWFHDPDGNTLSLTQFVPGDQPSIPQAGSVSNRVT